MARKNVLARSKKITNKPASHYFLNAFNPCANCYPVTHGGMSPCTHQGSKLIEFACGSPRYFHGESLYGIGLGNHTRPPQKQVRRFFPINVVRPRFLKHKNGKSALTEHLTLNAITFTECITRKNGPVFLCSKGIDPVHIWRVGIKSLFKMHDLPDFIG